MARKALIAKEKRRQRTVAKYAEKRKELKANGDYAALQKLPRDSSATRQNNRCNMTGRVRGYYRKFGLSRLMFRELALQGKIPGVIKSSW
ncbi:MAG: 30S ribosomal protein S14 [Ignavibacteria bacterium]|jgi:small subunit ribosomal protein S14|nr:30S ribosomal protein S14 [Ignavibacteria bacterium]MBK6876726.1 30S ribosomal protein S14 [Ignavibacteria bacterium]MBK9229093.1 30S ribosomal protein S14 [Ignavibacteria bacterium]